MSAVAIAEDGNQLAGHTCTSEAYMSHDLGITSDWKHENYNKHYGEGNWQLEWVDDVDIHVGLQKAFELNAKLAEDATEQEDNKEQP